MALLGTYTRAHQRTLSACHTCAALGYRLVGCLVGPRRLATPVSRILLPALLLATILAGTSQASAQAPVGKIYYSQRLVFLIPFETEPADRRLQQIQLYFSSDLGRTWVPYANATPDRRGFEFHAEKDGIYWFALRTLDQEGHAYPATLDALQPGLKVCVDTQPPSVTLRPLTPRDGNVGVEWDVRDDNLDLTSFRLEYRVPGGPDWLPLAVEGVASGQHYWNPGTNGAVEVRLRVRDLAQNWGEGTNRISLSGEGAGPGKLPDPGGGQPGAGAASLRLVNSKRFNLNYEIKDKGPSDVSVVELWYTPDGRNWQLYRKEAPNPPFVVEVTSEGRYGFTLIARSGVGLGERPPQLGDAPQLWVEVDVTKPVVRLLGADVDRASDMRNLTIVWSASDKNFGRQPITLSYAEQPDGNWTVIDKTENTGRYVWQMPQGVPYRFYVRVTATDLAGNAGVAQTQTAVIVDLSKPKARILDVNPTPAASGN
jgi:hypothetical protein